MRQRLARAIGFPVIMAKPRRGVVFLDPEPSFTSKMSSNKGDLEEEQRKLTHCRAFSFARVRRSWPTLNTYPFINYPGSTTPIP